MRETPTPTEGGGTSGSRRLLAVEARVLTLAPLASVAVRAPELLSQGRFGELLLTAVSASIVALVLAVAFRVTSAILDV